MKTFLWQLIFMKTIFYNNIIYKSWVDLWKLVLWKVTWHRRISRGIDIWRRESLEVKENFWALSLKLLERRNGIDKKTQDIGNCRSFSCKWKRSWIEPTGKQYKAWIYYVYRHQKERIRIDEKSTNVHFSRNHYI